MFKPDTRQRIIERSGGLCERKLPGGNRCLCQAVDIHHIVPKGMGGRKGVYRELIDDERNGMACCRGCHTDVGCWDNDADSLVPGAEFRAALRTGKGLEALRPMGGPA